MILGMIPHGWNNNATGIAKAIACSASRWEMIANDTAKIVKQISKRGINVIGIALEDETSRCYDSLKSIYPNLVKCDSLKELTKKLLGIIAKIL